MNLDCYRGRRVFVTGHTGFKGSWLCEWLLSLGAEVHGFALEPPTEPALFDQLGLAKRIASHTIGDVRDRETLANAVAAADPDFVFHLVEWYGKVSAGEEASVTTRRQIREYGDGNE